ncbi:MAG: hypothetical protein J6R80_03860 [Kiritimatiellae bacterium]|nr:hypothetical protein [Kiritimatiellia bacterium]
MQKKPGDHILKVTDITRPFTFDPTRPLEVEVGCGKGRFLTSLAKDNPDCEYLGIERMLERVRLFDGNAAAETSIMRRSFGLRRCILSIIFCPSTASERFMSFSQIRGLSASTTLTVCSGRFSSTHCGSALKLALA